MKNKFEIKTLGLKIAYDLIHTNEKLLVELRESYKKFPNLKEEISETARLTKESISDEKKYIKKLLEETNEMCKPYAE